MEVRYFDGHEIKQTRVVTTLEARKLYADARRELGALPPGVHGPSIVVEQTIVWVGRTWEVDRGNVQA